MTTSNQDKIKVKVKDATRKGLKKQRLALSKKQQTKKSKRIVSQVLSTRVFHDAQKVAFYLAVRGEADPQKLMHGDGADKGLDEYKSLSKQFYLPVLSQNKDEGLVFAKITKDTQFENNKFSIPEPIVSDSDLIKAEELDLVIMPLLGFDRQGNRLGMGGGFYDRCFAFKNENKKKTKPKLMGFAYDFQEFKTLTAEPWDIPLDFIATESEIILPDT